MTDPAVMVIRNRVSALKQEAHMHKSEYHIHLYGPDAAQRMALGCWRAARELERLADELERGEVAA